MVEDINYSPEQHDGYSDNITYTWWCPKCKVDHYTPYCPIEEYERLANSWRDLKYEYLTNGNPGTFLCGGNETNVPIGLFGYRSSDVNANGIIGDDIIGLNRGTISTNILFSNAIATNDITVIIVFKDGPAVSLNGSPTVSPTIAALCASEPFPPKCPASIYFLALSHRPPEFDISKAKIKPEKMLPPKYPPRA